ncbi:MAG: hypothetical protein WC365_01105 [Candidatus Babeliales bacterium]
MSRTIRRTRVKGQKIQDKDASKFCHHDITPILKGMRQSQKAEDKAYFERTGETKYKQKPKSRGSSW